MSDEAFVKAASFDCLSLGVLFPDAAWYRP